MLCLRHVEYKEGKFHGYVDVGSGTYTDTTPVAKDALVIMAVSLTEQWKIPIAYFLIDGLSGEERANLVNEAFIRLHNTGVRPISLTCDGPPCHFTMLRCLGVDTSVDTMDPTFPKHVDSSSRIPVFLDVCHMVKLLRNCFDDNGIIITEDGREVRWQYVRELVNLQEREGLRLANRLTKSHLQWRNQKMKVRLAVQVFSKSVADALTYCNENLKLPQFEGCEATVEFIRHVNDVFDVLNSKNPLAQGTRAPLREDTFTSHQKILIDARNSFME